MIQKFKQQLQYGTKTIEYSIINSRRIKTSEIIVDADDVIVRTPFHKPVVEISDIVRKKANWILKKQLEYKNQNPEIMKPTFQDNSMLPYSGKNYALKIIANHQGSEKIEFENGEFLIYINSKSSKKKVRNLYEKWLTETAQSFLDKKIKQYSKELQVESHQIKLKNLRSRWGSVTKDGTINLNVDLLKAPTDVIDYIILHELCHLKIKGHSHRFWGLVHKLMPNYQERIDWLKVNGSSLF
ncbi:MAG: M48 family metallopeptidase [Thermoproteota archaeon]|nr:M48 family metallopeptidase [Thermoproteota archaeon]